MKKIILHCGMPKTGSSALQVQFSKGRDGLLKHGYNYLKMSDFDLAVRGKISSGNAAGLARAYLFEGHPAALPTRRAELTEKFVKEAQASEAHVILSSEFFSVIPRPNMPLLVKALSQAGEVQLVFFVREQMNFLASAYIQQVKRHGLREYPDEYFASWQGYKAPLMYFSYFDQLSKGLDDVKIFAQPYERSRSHRSGLMGLFLDMIGADIPDTDLVEDLKVNLSPSAKEVKLMLEINKHNPRMQFSDMLVESSHKSGRSKIHSQHTILPPALKAEVLEFFREENEKFFEKYAKSENIYKPSEQTDEFVDLRKISFEAEDVVQIVTGILVDLDNRLARLEKGA